jgi:NAD(P)-dependent dehydrogenase (short-subunit alcohol dehydrogenase family)
MILLIDNGIQTFSASQIPLIRRVKSLLARPTAVYSPTKGAVDAITGVPAKEFGPRKIRVNSINPGIVEARTPWRRTIRGG